MFKPVLIRRNRGGLQPGAGYGGQDVMCHGMPRYTCLYTTDNFDTVGTIILAPPFVWPVCHPQEQIVKTRLNLPAVLLLTALLFLSLLAGCSGGGPTRYDPGIPAQVASVTAKSGNGLVTLNWSASTAATSYNVYYVSAREADTVTRSNSTRLNVETAPQVISGLDNGTTYLFMVTALNRDGESEESQQVSATPGPITNADLSGAWYFHTLVSGDGGRWERGLVTIDANGAALVSDYSDSSGSTQAPAGFSVSITGDGEVTQSGAGAWPSFHGVMNSRKEMIVATFCPTLTSRAITVFQRKKDDGEPDYTIADIMGAGSGQNPNDPTLSGNGPTRFSYHQLSAGANNDWEYGNARVGQHGNTWLDEYKDVTYWDYASPTFHLREGYDFFWKVTSFGIDRDGLVSEYWNYEQTGTFNTLTPHGAHEVVFSGRMTADRTVVVGVGTRSDAGGLNPRHFLRIMELNFKPVDQSIRGSKENPITLANLAGSYRFHKLTSSGSSSAGAYGVMTVSDAGVTTFPTHNDSATGTSSGADSFTLSYLPDTGSGGKTYGDFANYASAARDGAAHYYLGGNPATPFHTYYDFWSYPSDITRPATWLKLQLSGSYYNEHGSLSYTGDLFVLTRGETSGSSLIIGIK